MLRRVIIAGLVLFCSECQQPAPPNPPPQPDADAAPAPPPLPVPPATSACANACAQLVTYGCAWGSDPRCPGVMQLDNDKRRIRTPKNKYMTCDEVAAARSQADVNAAGISCP